MTKEFSALVDQRIMSKELANMLSRKRNNPQEPTNQFGWGMDTVAQLKAARKANRLLRKAKFFTKHDRFDVLPAECCANGTLRPLWHGRV